MREFNTKRQAGWRAVVCGVSSAALCSGVLFATSAAEAASYNVNFEGTSFDLSAVVTTTDTIDPAVGGYDITGISGTVTGPVSGAITGLIANPGQPYQGLYTDPATGLQWYYNNVLYTGAVAFDNNGLLFNFGAGDVGNLYSVGSELYLSVAEPNSFYNPGDDGAGGVSATPLPASFPLFAFGIGALGMFVWFRDRRNGAATIAA